MMRKILKSSKGFMLVEVLVALLILGIIVVSFTQVFSSGVITIFSMGHRTRAVSNAQAVLDSIYQDGIVDHTVAGSNFSTFPIAGKADEADLTSMSYDADNPIYYSVESQSISGTSYHRVTVLVYYQNGDRFVTLTALIP